MITQGKWEVKEISYPKDREYWIANNGNVIARVTRVLTDETEALDNAHLIAAAPELLEACKGIMAAAVKMAEDYHVPDNESIWAWIEDCSDALAKAEQAIESAENKV